MLENWIFEYNFYTYLIHLKCVLIIVNENVPYTNLIPPDSCAYDLKHLKHELKRNK